MKKLLLILVVLIFHTLSGFSQPLSTPEIDQLVERTMKTFHVPGMAVAVIKDGKVVHSKGYGVEFDQYR